MILILFALTLVYKNIQEYNFKTESKIEDVQEELTEIKIENEKLHREISDIKEEIKLNSRGDSIREIFVATAYDLSVDSCGKSKSHPDYGITASGFDLKEHTLESARAIAVDPKVIKLGSKVEVEFVDVSYQYLNGIYTAVDTGGAIKGKKIDVFFGSGNVSKEVKQFGVRKCKVTILD